MVRLLTYNIHKGIGGRDRLYRLERTIEVIEQMNPDLLCLQEVARRTRRSHFDNQPELLREYFKAEGFAYQFNVELRAGGYGNLLLSRWPMASHHHVSLRFSNKKPRGAQIAVIDTPEGPLQLVNLHLGLAEAERRWQVAHLLTHRLLEADDDLPTLLAGDWNDWRNTLHGGTLSECGFVHVTAPPSRFRSFPAYLPVGSLDKVFRRGSVCVREAFVVRNRLSRLASDHLPLVVDLHVSEEFVNCAHTAKHDAHQQVTGAHLGPMKLATHEEAFGA